MQGGEIMKRNESYVKQLIGDKWVIVAIGEASIDFNAAIYLNRTSSELWDLLEEEKDMDDLVTYLVDTYGISHERASQDVTAFLSPLTEIGAIQ